MQQYTVTDKVINNTQRNQYGGSHSDKSHVHFDFTPYSRAIKNAFLLHSKSKRIVKQ